ncbi:MAG: hypothetical protein AAF754_15800 [Pseudomonadota bacterium]
MTVYQDITQLLSDFGTILPEADWDMCERSAQRARATGHSALQTMRADAMHRSRRTAALEEAARTLAFVNEATGNATATVPTETANAIAQTLASASALKDEHAAVALQSRALQAAVHCQFNRRYAGAEQNDEPIIRRNVLRFELNRDRKEIDAILRDRFSNAVNGQPSVQAGLAALTSAAQIELLVPDLSRRAALVLRDAERLLAEGRGSEAEIAGRLATDYSATIREAVTIHAAMLSVSIEAFNPINERPAQELLKSAVGQSFDAKLPNGTDTELHHITGTDDGALIELRGFCVSTESFRDGDGKLISRAILEDPSSGARVQVMGVFANWAHSGLARGAAVNATGTWRNASGLNSGSPALEVTQLPLTTLAASAWRFAVLELGGKWFPRWRNNLQIDWSISPHLIESDSHPLRQGAVELVFLSILRSSP